MNPITIRIRHLFVLATGALALPLAAQQPAAPAGAAPAGAQPGGLPSPAASYVPSRMIEMKPDDKRPLLLKVNERNPYARRSPDRDNLNEGGENEEELKIREMLSTLSVTGRSNGPNGFRILLGDIIIEQGRLLPQLLEEQSENLQVIEVSDDSIVLGWLDIETGELTGKTMQMAYDLTPRVTYALHGQEIAGTKEGAESRRMGVLHVVRERQKEKSRMAERFLGNNEPADEADDGR